MIDKETRQAINEMLDFDKEYKRQIDKAMAKYALQLQNGQRNETTPIVIQGWIPGSIDEFDYHINLRPSVMIKILHEAILNLQMDIDQMEKELLYYDTTH